MKILKKCFSVFISGIVAVAILSLLMCCYYNIPVHEDDPKGITSYKFPSNAFWLDFAQGFSFGNMDANGYNNLSVVDNPDIIVMGSSQLQGRFVMQSDLFSNLLSEKLNGKYSIYNFAMANHGVYENCQNLPKAIESYESVPKVAFVETTTTYLTNEKVQEVVTSTVPHQESHSDGIVGTLQKIPFIRCLYMQYLYGLFDRFLPVSSEEQSTETTTVMDIEMINEAEVQIDESAYETFFSYLSDIKQKYGTQIVIMYHPLERLMSDGSLGFASNNQCNEVFENYAEKYGIEYFDMSEYFEEIYYEDHHLAHGFCNTEITRSHLNKYGNAALADAMYDEILKLEEEGKLCK